MANLSINLQHFLSSTRCCDWNTYLWHFLFDIPYSLHLLCMVVIHIERWAYWKIPVGVFIWRICPCNKQLMKKKVNWPSLLILYPITLALNWLFLGDTNRMIAEVMSPCGIASVLDQSFIDTYEHGVHQISLYIHHSFQLSGTWFRCHKEIQTTFSRFSRVCMCGECAYVYACAL